MAFLQLALPGLLRMAGQGGHPLPTVRARLTRDLKSRNRDWTEFRDVTLGRDPDGTRIATPYLGRSRLQAIARADGLACIPEGVDCLPRGDTVPVQVLVPAFGGLSVFREGRGQG
jgi:molybdopterin molybdotransferase